MSEPSQFDLLKQRRFGPFFGVQFLGAFNDNVYKNALVIMLTFQAASMTTLSAGLLVNLCSGLFILPYFLFSGTAEQMAAFCDTLGLRFGLTTEAPGLNAVPTQEARNYFHSVRFIRFHEHLRIYQCPLWMADVDAIVNRDLGTLFRTLEGRDAAMRIRPGRLEPQNQFNACVIGATPGPRSAGYYRQIAAYIADFYRKKALRWGIDQLAMYAVFADLQDQQSAPALTLLDVKAIDYDYLDDGFFWCSSGSRKFQQLQRASAPGTVPPAEGAEARYVAAFEHHWRTAQTIAAGIGWKI